MSTSTPLLGAYSAQQPGTVAAALPRHLHGGPLADAAMALADFARAYSASSADSDAAARLADAASFFRHRRCRRQLGLVGLP